MYTTLPWCTLLYYLPWVHYPALGTPLHPGRPPGDLREAQESPRIHSLKQGSLNQQRWSKSDKGGHSGLPVTAVPAGRRRAGITLWAQTRSRSLGKREGGPGPAQSCHCSSENVTREDQLFPRRRNERLDRHRVITSSQPLDADKGGESLIPGCSGPGRRMKPE